MKVTIYTPESAMRSPRKMFAGMWQDLVQSRELSWRLAIRDIKGMYRQSFLGLFWAFLLPFANTITWIFLKGSGILHVATTNIPYPVYVLSGTMLWSIFMDSLIAPLTQTTAVKDMLSKINFPREAIIMSGILQTLFNSVIKVAIIIVALIAIKVYPGWSLLLLPFSVIALILVGTVLGLLLTPLGMLYTDVGKFIPLAMQFFIFVTPVLFPIPASGWVRNVYVYNPLTPLIMTARGWLTSSPVEFLNGFFLVSLTCIVILFFVWIIYRAAMPILIERMSA
jgi:homopolymeric O-antigen transport system permease protein